MSANPHPLPLSACPACGYEMDAASSATDPSYRPRPEDYSLCGKCGEVLVYAADLTLRAADLKDMLALDDEQGRLLTHLQRTIRRERFIK